MMWSENGEQTYGCFWMCNLPRRSRVQRNGLVRRALGTAAVFIALISADPRGHSAVTAVIGDSLSAEYEFIPDLPGVSNPTDYARVTVSGWESMSWVEILARLRPDSFDFGRHRSSLSGWRDLRLSGYEFNFAIPGFRAAQYEDVINSSLFSNTQYLPLRSRLEDVLEEDAKRVVIWLGANEFRSKFGYLADGGDSASMVSNLTKDLKAVVDFVEKQNSNLEVVLVNLPDLGAAPDKRDAYPSLEQRERVTYAIRQANEAIAAVAASRNIAVADVFALTARLAAGTPTFFGAVEIVNESHPDNHPGYHFTRDGLHPNTPAQIEIARVIIDTFNAYYAGGVSIPQITDAEALDFLGIDPHQPYRDWASQFRLAEAGMHSDPDGDGLVNIVELGFGSDPRAMDKNPVRARAESGGLTIGFRADPAFTRLVRPVVQVSEDLKVWVELPEESITVLPDGSVRASVPFSGEGTFLRVNVVLIPPATE